jgi:hypothetical protein
MCDPDEAPEGLRIKLAYTRGIQKVLGNLLLTENER